MNKIIYILFLALLTACSFIKEKHNSIIIGSFCGECFENCFHGYFISGDSVYELTSNYIDTINLEKKKIVQDKNKIETIKKIEKLLPSNLMKYAHEIGSPDSRDQCGIYI